MPFLRKIIEKFNFNFLNCWLYTICPPYHCQSKVDFWKFTKFYVKLKFFIELHFLSLFLTKGRSFALLQPQLGNLGLVLRKP